MDYQVDNICNYINSEEKFLKIADEIYLLTEHLDKSYPDYKIWFYNKQIKGCIDLNRNIIFVRNNEGKIIGISSLKKTNEEKKICTLFILEPYRNRGIKNLLLNKSFLYLETEKPLITISEEKLNIFQKTIEEYHWRLTEIVEGIYRNNSKEFCFNGSLLKTKKK